MHLEILVEDKSGGIILAALVNSLLRNYKGEKWTYSIHPHRGVGKVDFSWNEPPKPHTASLLNLLPAKLRAYRKVLSQPGFQCVDEILVVVLDADDNSPDELRSAIRRMGRLFAPEIGLVIGVAVEELEAWALADESALAAAFPDYDRDLYATYKQDAVCGTWETLARIIMPPHQAQQLIAVGYPAVGAYKHYWASALAKNLAAENNRSPSFRKFKNDLYQMMRLIERNNHWQNGGNIV